MVLPFVHYTVKPKTKYFSLFSGMVTSKLFFSSLKIIYLNQNMTADSEYEGFIKIGDFMKIEIV